MVLKPVQCTKCKSTDVIKFGLTHNKKQRYKCNNKNCACKTFILDYSNNGCLPEVKDDIVKMSINGSGVRDIAIVKGISTDTVMNELIKRVFTDQS